MVQLLAAEGLSTRAIAPMLGVSHMQVGRDLKKSGGTFVTRDPAPTERVVIAEQRAMIAAELANLSMGHRPLSDDKGAPSRAEMDAL